ncbi:hypothetical protein VOLCADRAFT_103362 [Volvox carteri f. nagariensis]|uniref:Serine aminopeptidase S33 domain-containing protein n=1 Tax=Volvox carteri f. nagariensis TaxID=3068 RepID=D8TLF5_VOLCA|nr:uncharacterized protein VOLCADRAFT_103362 [Volvox carteri f. nagariensis]EFJ51724.1 hypothetical protein VOLCADRAFT_103362 [Volvox carteri f. nagariensis]|eukprot:XP_002947134.1 hypothetical protein VOLCADRAFT_103362 [Volvox carteri f. nagariensis]
MIVPKLRLFIALVLVSVLALNFGSQCFRPVVGSIRKVGKLGTGKAGRNPRNSVRGHDGTAEDELLGGGPAPNSESAGGNTPYSLLSKSMSLLSGGKYEEIEGIEAVWQGPPLGTARRGVMFIAHGCNHGAIDWWPQSPSCPQCIGLPEELNVTLHCLVRGYAVVAVSSAARRGSRCWQSVLRGGGDPWDYSQGPSPEDWMRTRRQVRRVLDVLLSREGLSSLPLLALGASSGGAFVLGLPLVMPGRFSGLAVQIMGGPPGLLQKYRYFNQSAAWPPTLFVHMPRDAALAELVARNLEELREGGVRTREIQVRPQPLTPLYLVQRCAPEVDEQTSRAVYEALKFADFLDPRGYLRLNPRSQQGGGWRAVLKAAGVPELQKLRLQPEASPIAEELNLLYAGHELCSETTTDMLDWFEELESGPKDGRNGRKRF